MTVNRCKNLGTERLRAHHAKADHDNVVQETMVQAETMTIRWMIPYSGSSISHSVT